MMDIVTFIIHIVFAFAVTFDMNSQPSEFTEICDNLSLVSYNSRGFADDRKHIIKDLLQTNDIVLLQEHWLYDSQVHKLQSLSSDHMVHMVSGMDESKDIYGRPYGGCAILWRKSLSNTIVPIDTKSKRIAAIKLTYENSEMVIFSVYMPCDNGSKNISEYSDVLDDISVLFHEHSVQMAVIGGDFNCDFGRSSQQTALLKSYVRSTQLFNVNCNYDIDYTCRNSFTGTSSLIDHFFVTQNLIDCVTKVNVMHRGDNLSDHSPIELNVRIPTARTAFRCRAQCDSLIDWHNITDDHKSMYVETLNKYLDCIYISEEVVNCSNLHCTNCKHIDVINNYCSLIMESCILAGEQVFPIVKCSSDKGPKIIPGWKEYVEPYREKSIFWHNIWIDCGRPKLGQVADLMRRSRAQYHYAVRCAKNQNDKLRNQKLADSLCNNKNRDYWKEIKKIKGVTSNTTASIDGVTEDVDIANIFCNKYSELYKSVSFSDPELDSLLESINCKVNNTPLDNLSCRITQCDVSKAVGLLNSHKADGLSSLMSNHLIFGGQNLHCHLAKLLSMMLRHGVSPELLKCSVMIPIPKSRKKNLSSSDNYRAIALINSIAKVLDLVILNRYGDLLQTNDLQFGFKPNSSTNTCTHMVKETVKYYIENDSNVYAAVIDATKAFDRVNFCKLFDILIKRGLPMCVVRLIVDMYVNQKMFVKWNTHISNEFDVRNGIKQGGILSPILFCVYIDDLFNELKKCNSGCYVGRMFCGAFGYADDLMLLCPSVSGLQTLIDKCFEFGKMFDIEFNTDKSKVIVFHAPGVKVSDTLKLTLGTTVLEIVDKVEHLGHVLTSVLSDIDDINVQLASFNKKSNVVLSDFRGINGFTRLKMLQTYCYSFYGCQLWRFNDPALDKLAVQWRKSCRKALMLPIRTHNVILPLICDTLPFDMLLIKRYLKFIMSCLCNENKQLQFITLNAMNVIGSTCNMNVNYLMKTYGLSVFELQNNSYEMNVKKILINYCKHIDPIQKAQSQVLQECINMRDSMYTSILDRSECNALINCLATG